MTSPYSNLPSRNFWRTGINPQSHDSVYDLYEKKFSISKDQKIAVAGSCFAQHISKRLCEKNFSVLDMEPAPSEVGNQIASKFGYGVYSARYGNIYTTSHLWQLAQEAWGQLAPADAIWEKDGRYFDALRPTVEPYGHKCPELVKIHRANHLQHVKKLFQKMDIFIFTFGLTESWIHKETGTVYPTAPGTVAGNFSSDTFEFHNMAANEVLANFLQFKNFIQRENPGVRYLLTVSPVPLTATATGNHVLTATTYSKSVLRAVAGQLSAEFDEIDYFPSYELIATHYSGGRFYNPNLRTVSQAGVDAVMRVFFSQHSNEGTPGVAAQVSATQSDISAPSPASDEDVICEDILLEAFFK